MKTLTLEQAQTKVYSVLNATGHTSGELIRATGLELPLLYITLYQLIEKGVVVQQELDGEVLSFRK